MPDRSDKDNDFASAFSISFGHPDEFGRWSIVITGDENADLWQIQQVLRDSRIGPLTTLVRGQDPVRFKVGTEQLRLLMAARVKLSDAWIHALSTYGVTSIGELNAKTGGSWIDTEATLSELTADGVLLCLVVGGSDARSSVPMFPAFQFDADGNVLPVMSDIAQRLTNDWDVEARLLWLTSPSGWLVNQAPADLLATSPETVLRALELTLGAA